MPHLRSGLRDHGGRWLALQAAAALAFLLVSGCSSQDATCKNGEYPAAQVNGPGSYCVPDGQEPDTGFVRYPDGKVPRHVGDEWDVYWRTHRLDAQGNEIAADTSPAASVATSAKR
ncbi:hypothetical protein Acy02nite_86380 [Actinoplanes cyaneus]|uniref:Lipoprotein n=1 Tax=Actinoplanes cyaneus TaxID=52696 RepID=A0A919IUJ2_9ACTN|nr:hypothetical protein [Actinoplanes cyaneus]MCW2144066.1 hypothetical protein [Actinoplanes cyaneus]GID70757.1 hypothetical protein Acy02nite_86380 [Actinoplanes cyaneus]